MGFFGKLFFWKRKEMPKEELPSANEEIREPFPQEEYPRFEEYQQRYTQPPPYQQPNVREDDREFQILASKLDVLNAKLDVINQRLANLERVQQSSKTW